MWSQREQVTSYTSWLRSMKALSMSWRCKTRAAATSSSRTCRSCPKMSGVKPRTPQEPPCSREEPEVGPFGFACPGFCRSRTLWLPGEPLLRWGSELIRNMVIIWFTSAGWLARRLGRESGPSSTTRNLLSQAALEQSFQQHPGGELLPEPLWKRLDPGALSWAVGQMETIKFSAGKTETKQERSPTILKCVSVCNHNSRGLWQSYSTYARQLCLVPHEKASSSMAVCLFVCWQGAFKLSSFKNIGLLLVCSQQKNKPTQAIEIWTKIWISKQEFDLELRWRKKGLTISVCWLMRFSNWNKGDEVPVCGRPLLLSISSGEKEIRLTRWRAVNT